MAFAGKTTLNFASYKCLPDPNPSSPQSQRSTSGKTSRLGAGGGVGSGGGKRSGSHHSSHQIHEGAKESQRTGCHPFSGSQPGEEVELRKRRPRVGTGEPILRRTPDPDPGREFSEHLDKVFTGCICCLPLRFGWMQGLWKAGARRGDRILIGSDLHFKEIQPQ
uniref:Uncharacterized protein n=1 Tax=Mustela putorius furo TaxID=9669 RepID=M3YB16_MUSPF